MSGHGTGAPRLAKVVTRWAVLVAAAAVLPMGTAALAASASGLAAGNASSALTHELGLATRGQAGRPAVPGSLGATIAGIAEGQKGVEDNPPDTYCNPYSAYWGSGAACSNGLRAAEWCADFAAWAWRQAGALFTYGSGSGDIDAAARSFYSWASAHGTWHAAGTGYAPQPGDVAVYGSSAADASHVGIVVGMGSSGPDVVNGDWAIQAPYTGPPTAVVYVANENSSGPASAGGEPLVGFASPLGLGNGSFVQVSGTTAIYEIVGGAPLYVSSWAPFGGPQSYSVISQAQFNALSPVPANGTMIRSVQTGAIYIVAGGAPLYVSGCADFGGCAGDVNIDEWDIDNAGSAASHLSLVPANGTMIRSVQTDAIYVVAGGAPLYVSSCADFDGCAGDVNIDEWDIDNAGSAASHLSLVPGNGTMIRSVQTGAIYIVAGGAPLYVSGCADFGGCAGDVNIDQWDIDNAGSGPSHLALVPANGTMIRSVQTGAIYIVAGGAPLYLSSCAHFDGCAGNVDIDEWDIDNAGSAASHLGLVPANATFIRSGTGGIVYRVAGGYPFRISNCKAIGGCQSPVVVDPWDLAHLRNAAAHLRSAPRNGTVVRCYPSRKYWSFKADKRHKAKASKHAVAVDDNSVTHFPI
jgi:hypothetical protein